MKAKSLQREEFKQIVATITNKRRDELSLLVRDRLFSISGFGVARFYFLYCSMGSEPDTKGIFERLIQERKEVAFPVWHQKEQRLSWHLVTAWSQLQRRSNRIMEPEYSLQTEISAQRADWILVPGIAFDRRGYRLGRGAGMYDRTLLSLRNEARRVGLFFAVQEANQVIVEPHDERLDFIVTEKEIIDI